MILDAVDIPEALQKKITTWRSNKDPWMKRAETAMGYYYNDIEGTGTTYTALQHDNIKATTNIPVSINYIHPMLAQKHAILCAAKPSHKVVAFDSRQGAKEYAHVLDKAKHAVLYSSESITHIEEFVKEMLITGLSHCSIVEQEFSSTGQFNLTFQHLPISNVTIDPSSRTKTNQDMRGYYYEKELEEDMLQYLYGPIFTLIEEYYGKKLTIDDFMTKSPVSGIPQYAKLENVGNYRTADVIKFYDKAVAELYIVENEEGDLEYMFKENMFPEQHMLIDQGNVVKSSVNRYVRETTIIGGKIIAVQILPTIYFPLKTGYFEWGGKPYRSYGMVHFTKGMQEALDKTIQQLILNAMLLNNAGWTGPVGAVPEDQKQKWIMDGANPMAYKEYQPQVIDGTAFKPERDEVKPLGQHYPYIMELMRSGMEYSTGINPVMQGNPEGAKVDVFSTLQQYMSTAMYRINQAAQHINQIMEYEGKVLIDLLIANLKPNQYVPFFNIEGKEDEFQITKEMRNQILTGEFTVLAIPAESSPSQRIQMSIELMKSAQSNPDPVKRDIYTEEAYRLADMRGFDSIREKIDTAKNLQQQLEQVMQDNERLQQLSKQDQNRAIRAEVSEEVMRELLQIYQRLVRAETEAVAAIEIDKLKEQLKDAKKPKETKSKTT